MTSSEWLRWSGSTRRYKLPGLCPCGAVLLLRPITTSQTPTHTSRSHPQATTNTIISTSSKFTKVGLTSQIQIPGLCPCGTVDLLHPLTTIQTSTHTPRSHPRRRPMPSSRPPLSVDEVGLSTQNNIPWLCPCGTVVLLRPQTTIQTSTHTSRSHLQATPDSSAMAQTTISNRHWIPPATGLFIRRRSPRRWPPSAITL